MADGQSHTCESWRVVVFTNLPGGTGYSLVGQVVRQLGRRVVGVVTSPGPKRRRSPTYLEVAAADVTACQTWPARQAVMSPVEHSELG